MAAQAFYRFAAVESVKEKYKAHAISFVMIGGLFAAIIGPQTAKYTSFMLLEIPFVGGYLAAIIMNTVGGFLFFFFSSTPNIHVNKRKYLLSRFAIILSNRNVIIAIVCATIAYSLMNLVMTSTPLAVIGCGYSRSDAANIVTAHALSMYLPSFFTGYLISRYGTRTIMSFGTVFIGLAAVLGFWESDIKNFYADLILLGVGWNFLFVGATYLLTSSCDTENKIFVQGVNDFCVFGTVALASLTSGLILNCSSASSEIGWAVVNLSVLPFVALSALMIISIRPRTILT